MINRLSAAGFVLLAFSALFFEIEQNVVAVVFGLPGLLVLLATDYGRSSRERHEEIKNKSDKYIDRKLGDERQPFCYKEAYRYEKQKRNHE